MGVWGGVGGAGRREAGYVLLFVCVDVFWTNSKVSLNF